MSSIFPELDSQIICDIIAGDTSTKKQSFKE